MKDRIKDHAILLLLVIIGSMQMFGDLSGLLAVKALGAVSHASPAPKVFTAQDGFETFSSRFFVTWQDERGRVQEIELTPEVYRRIRGPYNRRNAYGAALSYGPVLARREDTAAMLDSIIGFAFCEPGSIRRELGLDSRVADSSFRIEVRPRDSGRSGG